MLTPNKSSTLTLAANGVPQNAALPSGGGLTLSLFNRGGGDAFVDFTSDANAATVVPAGTTQGGMPILANAPATMIQLRSDDTRITFISASTSTLYVTRGQGQT